MSQTSLQSDNTSTQDSIARCIVLRKTHSINRYQLKEPDIVSLVELYAQKRETSFLNHSDNSIVQTKEYKLIEINRELEKQSRDGLQIVLAEKDAHINTSQPLKHFELFEEEPIQETDLDISGEKVSSDDSYESKEEKEKYKKKSTRKKRKIKETKKQIREKVKRELKEWKKEIDEIKNYPLHYE